MVEWGQSRWHPVAEEEFEMFTPNLSRPMRIGYVVLGVALAASPLAISMEGWMQVVIPLLGVLAIATGATGW